MESQESRTAHKCLRCGDELPNGVRYCVACGAHNMDPGAGAINTAKCEMASNKRTAFWSSAACWYRWFHGIRR
ncbi:zinc-ribbon domain-containing protein [Aeoliella mucimassa]|uniref:Zinc-ribbon domain-containing protein n=1 Tax=Aeoliella mucimassa TaxID=2527972 RepID=A0A518AKS7_9BACT|nr:hypothetical protein [Aeoliella mucimassa]QDU55284.1 hypothetical protein Pan181_14730 [Aeoliella mucimassa]